MIPYYRNKQKILRFFVRPISAICGSLSLFAGIAQAGELNLAWDSVSDPHLGGYQVLYGKDSNHYSDSIDVGKQTSVHIEGLEDGAEYFFSVRAYAAHRSIRSNNSNEIAVKLGPPLAANFEESETSGYAPLVVTFSDSSLGEVTNWSWDFGDGTTSTAPSAIKSYMKPGNYTVTLKVSNSKGEATKTKLIRVMDPATPSSATVFANANGIDSSSANTPGLYTRDLSRWIESGSVRVDHQWRLVPFNKQFKDPVVVTGAFGLHDRSPAVLRIRNVSQKGFEIRVQEWDYLDGKHGVEAVNYLVMERGHHVLPNGTHIEAGSVKTDRTGQFETVSFSDKFLVSPVVLTSLNTETGADAVTTRVQNIIQDGFEVGMYKEEGSVDPNQHAMESISFIAWEPSIGRLDKGYYEVSLAMEPVDHKFHRINWQHPFLHSPLVFVGMQTAIDLDPANLRTAKSDQAGVSVMVSEEQSSDDEVSHSPESVGYIALPR